MDLSRNPQWLTPEKTKFNKLSFSISAPVLTAVLSRRQAGIYISVCFVLRALQVLPDMVCQGSYNEIHLGLLFPVPGNFIWIASSRPRPIEANSISIEVHSGHYTVNCGSKLNLYKSKQLKYSPHLHLPKIFIWVKSGNKLKIYATGSKHLLEPASPSAWWGLQRPNSCKLWPVSSRQ